VKRENWSLDIRSVRAFLRQRLSDQCRVGVVQWFLLKGFAELLVIVDNKRTVRNPSILLKFRSTVCVDVALCASELLLRVVVCGYDVSVYVFFVVVYTRDCLTRSDRSSVL